MGSVICGTCDCNLWMVLGFLIGAMFMVFFNVITEEAKRRKKLNE